MGFSKANGHTQIEQYPCKQDTCPKESWKLTGPLCMKVSFGWEGGNLATHELAEEGNCKIQVAMAWTVDHAFVD